MKTLSNMGFALFGAALVAISYGLARFAFGLFVPSISTELSITPAMIGYAKAFSLFCVAGVFIALLSPLYPGHIDYLAEDTPALLDSEEDTGLQAAYDQQLLDENGEPYEESVTTEPGDTSAQTNLANT